MAAEKESFPSPSFGALPFGLSLAEGGEEVEGGGWWGDLDCASAIMEVNSWAAGGRKEGRGGSEGGRERKEGGKYGERKAHV